MNITVKRFFVFALIFLNITPIQVQAQEALTQYDIEVDIYPKEITYNENAVIEIKMPSEIDASEIIIDTSEIGGSEKNEVDLTLMEHTITVNDTTTAGSKTITVEVFDEKGDVYESEIELEVLPREVKDELDFDWDEAVIYFLLTDRFMDGDPTNNDPNGEGYDTQHSETYHGGDFQGIIDQLDYLNDLGINTIWITPIVDNVDHNHRYGKEGPQYGYHGYWAKDFTKIDEHLGDLDTFKNLINEAHDRGIKIMVDVVINHTGYGMKITDSGEDIPNFPTSDEQAVFDGLLRENPLNGHDIVGEIYGLPDFKTEEPEVREQIIEWQTEWLERARTERGDTIDYFRVDTIKHVDDTTLNAFKNELTKIKPDFKLIGESWGATYNNTGGYLNSGQMDSLLDFDFKRIASMFAHGNIEQAEQELKKRNEAISNTATLGHFLSSHDEDGFLYYFMQGDEDLFKVAISLQLTAKGQPIIYYGEEIGLSGKAEGNMDQGEFSENRSDFDWDAIEGNHLVEHYKKLLASRNKHSKVFAKGTRTHLAGSNEEGYSVFTRSYGEEMVYVGINTTTEASTVNFNTSLEAGTQLQDEYNNEMYTVGEDKTVEVSIPSYIDGGTVILSLSEEEISDSTVDFSVVAIGSITALGIGFLVIKSKRKGN